MTCNHAALRLLLIAEFIAATDAPPAGRLWQDLLLGNCRDCRSTVAIEVDGEAFCDDCGVHLPGAPVLTSHCAACLAVDCEPRVSASPAWCDR